MPKRSKTTHDPIKLAAAIEAITAGTLSQRQAARQFGIPQATLNDKIKGKSPICPVSKTLLTQEEEDKLAVYLLRLATLGFTKNADEVRQLAGQILTARASTARSKDNIPTTSWLYGFFSRHPELSRSPMSLGIKPVWSDATRCHMFDTGEGVGLDTFAQVLSPVWHKTATEIIAAQSFKAAGIFPLDADRVLASGKLGACSAFPEDCTQEPYPPPPMKDIASTSIQDVPSTSLSSSSPSTSLQDTQSSSIKDIPEETSSTPFPPTLDTPSTSIPPPENILSTTHPLKLKDPPENSLSCHQLAALKDFGLFLYDELGKNQFLHFFNKLSSPDSYDEGDERYLMFKGLATSLLVKCQEENQEKANPTMDDILKIPNFAHKGKGKSRARPTIPLVVSGEEFREVQKKK